jgi:hypothetical protein
MKHLALRAALSRAPPILAAALAFAAAPLFLRAFLAHRPLRRK